MRRPTSRPRPPSAVRGSSVAPARRNRHPPFLSRRCRPWRAHRASCPHSRATPAATKTGCANRRKGAATRRGGRSQTATRHRRAVRIRPAPASGTRGTGAPRDAPSGRSAVSCPAPPQRGRETAASNRFRRSRGLARACRWQAREGSAWWRGCRRRRRGRRQGTSVRPRGSWRRASGARAISRAVP